MMDSIKEITSYVRNARSNRMSDADIFNELREKVPENIYRDLEIVRFINMQASDETRNKFKMASYALVALLFSVGAVNALPIVMNFETFGNEKFLYLAAGFFMPTSLSYFVLRMKLGALQIIFMMSALSLGGAEFDPLGSISILLRLGIIILTGYVINKGFSGCLSFHKNIRVPGQDRFVS